MNFFKKTYIYESIVSGALYLCVAEIGDIASMVHLLIRKGQTSSMFRIGEHYYAQPIIYSYDSNMSRKKTENEQLREIGKISEAKLSEVLTSIFSLIIASTSNPEEESVEWFHDSQQERINDATLIREFIDNHLVKDEGEILIYDAFKLFESIYPDSGIEIATFGIDFTKICINEFGCSKIRKIIGNRKRPNTIIKGLSIPNLDTDDPIYDSDPIEEPPIVQEEEVEPIQEEETIEDEQEVKRPAPCPAHRLDDETVNKIKQFVDTCVLKGNEDDFIITEYARERYMKIYGDILPRKFSYSFYRACEEKFLNIGKPNSIKVDGKCKPGYIGYKLIPEEEFIPDERQKGVVYHNLYALIEAEGAKRKPKSNSSIRKTDIHKSRSTDEYQNRYSFNDEEIIFIAESPVNAIKNKFNFNDVMASKVKRAVKTFLNIEKDAEKSRRIFDISDTTTVEELMETYNISRYKASIAIRTHHINKNANPAKNKDYYKNLFSNMELKDIFLFVNGSAHDVAEREGISITNACKAIYLAKHQYLNRNPYFAAFSSIQMSLSETTGKYQRPRKFLNVFSEEFEIKIQNALNGITTSSVTSNNDAKIIRLINDVIIPYQNTYSRHEEIYNGDYSCLNEYNLNNEQIETMRCLVNLEFTDRLIKYLMLKSNRDQIEALSLGDTAIVAEHYRVSSYIASLFIASYRTITSRKEKRAQEG